MLKWTARAFAMAAAMQIGFASAQEVEADATAVPPGPAISQDAAEEARDATEDARDVTEQAQEEAREEARDVNEDVRDAQQDALENRQDAVEDTRENLQDARDEVQDAREDAAQDLNDDIEREARFRPEANDTQFDDRIRAATANLNIDDETRSRYRWHNGEWWFKTKSGNWKFYRDNQWQDFDPTTYRSMNAGGMYGPTTSGNYLPQGNTTYAQPQQFSDSNGYYYQSRPYTTQRYGVYRPNYDNRYYNQGWNNRGWNDGWNRGYYNDGYGYNSGWGTGYNPGNDRYYGRGPYGQPYSIEGDRYRGGVIGSQIGGQVGGRTGAIIGGAIGADAAD